MNKDTGNVLLTEAIVKTLTFFCVGHLCFSTCTRPHLLHSTASWPNAPNASFFSTATHMAFQELRYGFKCDWADWLSCWRTSCQSTCTYTMPLAKKKLNSLNLLRMLHQQRTGLVLEARSRQASRTLSHVRPRLAFACGVLMDCSAKPALDAAPFSCTQSRQASSWFRLLESLSLTSCSVTWALVITACVLDGALLGKRRKVIAKGMQRLNVPTAPLVCGWAQTGKTQAHGRASVVAWKDIRATSKHGVLVFLWPGEANWNV